jgi:hypothetical protein
MASVLEQKRHLMEAIIDGSHGLDIETVFGAPAWEFFQQQLHGNGNSIVVCGNGPVAPTCRLQKEIDESQLVIRCNDYLKVFGGVAARKSVGSRCDVQFICLHGLCFRKGGVQFLRDWCKESSIVLAMENTKARGDVTQAVKAELLSGDAFFEKIHFLKEDMVKTVFVSDCTRGFYALAFALQARRRLKIDQPVKCIGFGRRGHHNNSKQWIHHGHSEEMLLFCDMWRNAVDLVHLEWAEYSQELIAHVSRTHLLASSRPPPPDTSACQHMQSIETANASLSAVMALASTSSYYKSIPMAKIQAMVAHGLIIHPNKQDYLTCKYHQKSGKYKEFQYADTLLGHFSENHRHTCESPDPSQSQPTQELAAPALPIDGLHGGVWSSPHPQLPPVAEVQRFQPPIGDIPQAFNFLMPPLRPFNLFGSRPQSVHVNMTTFMRSYALFQHAAQIFSDAREDDATYWERLDLGDNCVSCLHELSRAIVGQSAEVKVLVTSKGAGWRDIISALNVAFMEGFNQTITFRGCDESFTSVLAALSNLMKQMVDRLLSLGDPASTHVAVTGILSFNMTCAEVEAKAIANLITPQADGAAKGVKFILSGIDLSNKYTGRNRPSPSQSAASSVSSQAKRAANLELDFLGPKRPRD